ncbi:MAG: helix-turn-helix domain-containing protein [Bosea sp.]|uniref:helix-turn-helix domain-containing protein n=1 Tax=Bosea sp. (in: a-proteobacteria) TaxID=1871050 RepID=UPI002387777B|nr:helix-turn-helix domain-containing protein [Bosea sp. (in: a-proteobacteria)]MCP4733460.1 helix-turn-helix domain-containing protein [Bosea sp. (in: a-proteobacteria)]
MMEISTSGLERGDPLDFWSQTVLKRMSIERRGKGDAPFHARLRRVAGDAGEFWDHFSTSIRVERSQQRCRADKGDEIYVGLVLDGRSEVSFDDSRLLLRAGDVYVTDFAQPIRANWLEHRELGVVFQRSAGRQSVGRLAQGGAVKLLISHLRALATEMSALSSDERRIAVDIAVRFARLVLAGDVARTMERDRPSLLAATRQLIAQRHADPELTVESLATALGCSRASLYRAFEHEPAGVAAAIWAARLRHARDLLLAEPATAIGSVAFRSGFLDQANFNRMFRREFGMAPGEFRQMAETGNASSR